MTPTEFRSWWHRQVPPPRPPRCGAGRPPPPYPTARELAARLGVVPASLYRWASGRRPLPKWLEKRCEHPLQ